MKRIIPHTSLSSSLCLVKSSCLIIIHPRYLQSGHSEDDLRKKKLSHYEVLGIKPTATPREIKSAYIKLCKELHPDTSSPLMNKHDKFVAINEAHSILSRESTRREYDRSLGVRSEYGPAGENFRYDYYRESRRRTNSYYYYSSGKQYYGQGWDYNSRYYSSYNRDQIFVPPVLFCIVIIGIGVAFSKQGDGKVRPQGNSAFEKKRQQELYRKNQRKTKKEASGDNPEFCGKNDDKEDSSHFRITPFLNPFKEEASQESVKSKGHSNPVRSSVPRFPLPASRDRKKPKFKYQLSQTSLLLLKLFHGNGKKSNKTADSNNK